MSRETWIEQLSVQDFHEPTPEDVGSLYDVVNDFLESQVVGRREVFDLSSQAIVFGGVSTHLFIKDPRIEGRDERDYDGELCVVMRLLDEVEEEHELELGFSARMGLEARLHGEELDAEQKKAWVYLGIDYATKLMEYKAGSASGHEGAEHVYRFLRKTSAHIRVLLQRRDEAALALAPRRSDQDWVQVVCDANDAIIGVIDEEDTTYFHHSQDVTVEVESSVMPPVGVLYGGGVGLYSPSDEVQVVSSYTSIEDDSGNGEILKDDIRIAWHGVRSVIRAGETARIRFRESLSIVDEKSHYEAEQDYPFELQEKKKRARIGDLKRFVAIIRAANRYGEIDKQSIE